LPSYAFNPSGSPPVDQRSHLGGSCNIPIILLTLYECSPERLPCLVEHLKATQLFPRPYPRITSHVYNIYETIPPLDTTWYTIWAKVIVIVATYRKVVTLPHPPLALETSLAVLLSLISYGCFATIIGRVGGTGYVCFIC